MISASFMCLWCLLWQELVCLLCQIWVGQSVLTKISNLSRYGNRQNRKTVDFRVELVSSINSLQAMASQLSENQLVKEELDMLDEDAKVYKLVGPVLMPQDLTEAKDVVATRIKFITGQVTEAETRAKDLEGKQQAAKLKLVEEQQAFQQSAQAVARNVPAAGGRG
jgi:prefoldin beta subunit